MKYNTSAFSAFTLALSICLLGTVSIHLTDPAWTELHIAGIVAGAGIFLIIRSLKWTTLVSIGPHLFAVTLAATLLGMTGTSIYGRHTVMEILCWKFCPAYFIPAGYVLSLAYGRKKRKGDLFILACTSAAITAACIILFLQSAKITLFIAGAVYGLYCHGCRYRKLKTCAVTLACAFIYILPVLMTERDYISEITINRLFNKLAVLTAASRIQEPIYNNFLDGALIQAGWKLGGLAPLLFIALWILLAATFTAAIRRTANPSARLCAIGCAIALILPTVSNVSHFLIGFPCTKECLSFLSYGTSLMLASFMLLGIFVNATDPTPKAIETKSVGRRTTILRIAGAFLLLIGLLHAASRPHPPYPKFHEFRPAPTTAPSISFIHQKQRE